MTGGSWQAQTGVRHSGRGVSLGRVSGLSGLISHQTVEGGRGFSALKLLWAPAMPHPLECPNPDTTFCPTRHSHWVVAEVGQPLRAWPAFQVGRWLSGFVPGLFPAPGGWAGGEQRSRGSYSE